MSGGESLESGQTDPTAFSEPGSSDFASFSTNTSSSVRRTRAWESDHLPFLGVLRCLINPAEQTQSVA